VSFLTIGIIWVNHHTLLEQCKRVAANEGGRNDSRLRELSTGRHWTTLGDTTKQNS